MTAVRIFVIAMLLLGSRARAQQSPARAATPPPATPISVKPATTQKGKVNFIGRGAPAGRVDAGSRGDGDEIASLYVLAPNEVGLSTSSQPKLYWFQTKPAELPFEISVLKPNDPQPVLRLPRTGRTTSGFHHLDLAEHGVRLEPGVDYQWVVALIRDPQSRSRDIVSSGWIRHAAREGGKDPSSLAAAGLWYDTISALFAQIQARPNDTQLTADRRDLFVQVGLPPLPSVPLTKRK